MKSLLTTCFFLLALATFAQSTTLGGRAVGAEGEPLLYANAILRSAPEFTFVKAAIADEEGHFLIPDIDTGRYQLTVSALGYVDLRRELTLTGGDRDLGELQLVADATTLEKVTVVAEKPIVQVLADKTVFNVDKTLGATGSSAWELLRKAPGVIVDNAGTIILEGKPGVQFYVNGRPSQLRGEELRSFLESLQSTDVESIELITQPSSRYEAAGNAGIINIVLRKDKSLGTNGTVTAGITAGAYARYRSSVSFNNRTPRGNLFGSYGNNLGERTGFLYLFRQQNGREFDARTNSVYDRNNHNFRLGYDYTLSERSSLGVLANANINRGTTRSDSRTPIRPLGAVINDSVLVANNRSETESENYGLNLNYVFKDTSGNRLSFDLDYGRYQSYGYLFQPNRYFDGTEANVLSQRITAQETPVDIDLAALQGDYETGLAGGTLSFGGKVSLVVTDNNFGFFTQRNGSLEREDDLSNRFEYRENINAGYVNYSRKWGKWSAQGGLRLENTVSDGELTTTLATDNARVKRNYLDVFPSGGLTYALNRTNSFGLTYSRRITRPNYSSLNPFEYKIDELSSRRGNPFLQPQYANNLKLTHTYKYRYNTSLSYAYITDFFAQITEADGANSNFISVRNIANQRVVNLGFSAPVQLKDWWSAYVSINAYRSSYASTNPEFNATTQETLSAYAQQTFTLPKGFKFEISGWYSSPSVWGGTYETKSIGALNLALQREFLNDKLNVRLVVNDVLFTSPWEGTTRFGQLFIDGTGGSDSRNAALTLTYDFGRDEVKKNRRRRTSGADERGRIGGG